MPKRVVNPRLLGMRRKQREARAKAYEKALKRWLKSYSKYLRRIGLENAMGQYKKQSQDDYFAEQLVRIMNLYGMREAADSANSAAGSVIIPSKLVSESAFSPEHGSLLGTGGTKIKWFWRAYENGVIRRAKDIRDDTKRRVNLKVNEMVQMALLEEPQPSVGALARRLTSQVFEEDYVFGHERAAVIARTELGHAQNSGTFEGYKETGVKSIEWLAYNDDRSGKRKHNKLNGVVVAVGESFHNKATGNYLRYPGDPMAPILDTVNCRCTIAPVI